MTGEGNKNDGEKSQPLYMQNPTITMGSSTNIRVPYRTTFVLRLDPQHVRNIIP